MFFVSVAFSFISSIAIDFRSIVAVLLLLSRGCEATFDVSYFVIFVFLPNVTFLYFCASFQDEHLALAPPL